MSTTSQRLRRIEVELRRAKAKLRKLLETVEDLDDLLALEKAKAENAGKPLIPWEVAAKELGIRPPPKKRPRKVRRAESEGLKVPETGRNRSGAKEL